MDVGPAASASTLVVEASGPLSGSVRIGGAKNSALKLMAATLLAPGRHRLTNVPRIADVEWMADVLVALGSGIAWTGADALEIDTADELNSEPPVALVSRMRASTALLGPLLSRCGEARIALPGGDDFGLRPVNLHFDGLRAMGATIDVTDDTIVAKVDRLHGAEVRFDYPTVGATETILLAAAMADGDTIIENAAREPEIADLAAFLNRMGAQVLGAGSPTIWISGVETLDSATHEVVADRVEAATFVCLVGAAGGEVLLVGARDDHLAQLIRVAGRARVRCAPDSAACGCSPIHPVGCHQRMWQPCPIPASPRTTCPCWWRCWPPLTASATRPRTSSPVASAMSRSWLVSAPTLPWMVITW